MLQVLLKTYKVQLKGSFLVNEKLVSYLLSFRNIQEKSEDSPGKELPRHSREKRREERKQPLSSLLTSELETTETVFNPVKYAQMLSDSKIELKKEKSKDSRSSKNSKIKNVKNIDKESEAGEEHGTNKIQPSATPNSEAKYYHIDKYLNQLMDLQLELNDTILKRSSILTELDHVQ